MPIISINGAQKVLNAITSKLSNYEMIEEKKITNSSYIDFIIKQASLYTEYSKFEKLNSENKITNMEAIKYTYDNGLEYFICKYTVNNHYENEYRLLMNGNTNHLCINTEREKKSIQELLSSTINDDYIPYLPYTDKIIESEHSFIGNGTEIYFEFTRVTDITILALALERFRAYHELYIENINEKQEALLEKIRFMTLEIIYQAYHPIYVQFANTKKKSLEESGYLPYKEEDILEVVNAVNLNVDAFINKISKTLDNINEKEPSKQLKKEILF